MNRCKYCGGSENAHFGPDKDWPRGICMCTMPDSPCGCSGFTLKGKVTERDEQAQKM